MEGRGGGGEGKKEERISKSHALDRVEGREGGEKKKKKRRGNGGGEKTYLFLFSTPPLQKDPLKKEEEKMAEYSFLSEGKNNDS